MSNNAAKINELCGKMINVNNIVQNVVIRTTPEMMQLVSENNQEVQNLSPSEGGNIINFAGTNLNQVGNNIIINNDFTQFTLPPGTYTIMLNLSLTELAGLNTQVRFSASLFGSNGGGLIQTFEFLPIPELTANGSLQNVTTMITFTIGVTANLEIFGFLSDTNPNESVDLTSRSIVISG